MANNIKLYTLMNSQIVGYIYLVYLLNYIETYITSILAKSRVDTTFNYFRW